MAAGQRANLFQRGFMTPARERRKCLAEFEVFNRDSQPPRRRATSEKLFGQRQQRARVGGMRHESRAVGGFELAHLDFGGGIHSGIHENHGPRFGNRFREFGRELMAHEGDYAGQVQLRNCGGHLRSHAVITAQGVAVTDNEKTTGFALGLIRVHLPKLVAAGRQSQPDYGREAEAVFHFCNSSSEAGRFPVNKSSNR